MAIAPEGLVVRDVWIVIEAEVGWAVEDLAAAMETVEGWLEDLAAEEAAAEEAAAAAVVAAAVAAAEDFAGAAAELGFELKVLTTGALAGVEPLPMVAKTLPSGRSK